MVAWLPAITDDPHVRQRLERRVKLWLPRLQVRVPGHAAALIDWVQDALIRSCDKDDPVAYAEALLAGWVAAGGRPHAELAAAPAPAPTAAMLPAPVPPPARPVAAPRSRTDAAMEAYRQGFAANKARRKEEADRDGA